MTITNEQISQAQTCINQYVQGNTNEENHGFLKIECIYQKVRVFGFNRKGKFFQGNDTVLV